MWNKMFNLVLSRHGITRGFTTLDPTCAKAVQFDYYAPEILIKESWHYLKMYV